jgi:hypothetical protein
MTSALDSGRAVSKSAWSNFRARQVRVPLELPYSINLSVGVGDYAMED